MAPLGRVPFSPEDDAHLVEYLAEVNKDRKGNKIYQKLVEDLDRFPWAKRHSWQAWRHRYMRDSLDFDRRVSIQQRRNLREIVQNARNEATFPTPQSPPAPEASNSPRREKSKELATRRPVKLKRGQKSSKFIFYSSEDDSEAEDLARRIRLGEGPSRSGAVTTMESNRNSRLPSVRQGSSGIAKDPNAMEVDVPTHHPGVNPVDPEYGSGEDTTEADLADVKDEEDEEDEKIAVGHMLLSPLRRSKSNDPPPKSGPVHQTSRDPSIPPPSSVTRTFALPEPTSWLTASDQSRLINSMIQTLSERYNFPPEYVLQVWKEAGDLNEAESILKELGNLAKGLLNKAVSRRSSSSSATENGEERSGHPAPNHVSVDTRLQQKRNSGVDPGVVLNPSPLRQSFSGDSIRESHEASPPLRSSETVHRPKHAVQIHSSQRSIPTPPTSVSPAHEVVVSTRRAVQSPIETRNATLESCPKKLPSKESVWPSPLQKVYSTISSPERKEVLQKFWKGYGDEFLRLEPTLNDDLQEFMIY
ncbi:hypothetical protein EV360DRAFT_79598 [Lentinula raphanica]|nr:hypothetical protein EV360DRAFT_79598 [Lentinula raphanica]